jgi:hypothetical protein
MPWPASWSELLATSRRWKSVGALGACAGGPWKFETVYHQGRPRNFDHEFGGWADKQNYPEHTENWESRRRMNISERWCRGARRRRQDAAAASPWRESLTYVRRTNGNAIGEHVASAALPDDEYCRNPTTPIGGPMPVATASTERAADQRGRAWS